MIKYNKNKLVSNIFIKLRFCTSLKNKLICFDKMPDYHQTVKSQLEKYWSSKFSSCNQTIEKNNKKKMYILSMFPYPSGQLHMGHMRVYMTADVLARYNKLLGKKVIFPMGWDSFGLPAENAAFERGYEPKPWTNENISEMKKQMSDQMSLSIDWNRELSTCDPAYFKWTQWIFCRLYENSLAYQRSELVNWDPVDHTVLADELVDVDGRSWRSGAVVQKIPLRQWFVRTTALTESLLDGLKTIKGGQWRHVIEAQKGWLGELEGVYVELDLVSLSDDRRVVDKLSVFTSTPVAALSGFAAFVEINQDNIWWNYSPSGQVTTTEYLSFHSHLAARHPLSGKLIPIIKNPNLKFKDEECLSSRMGFPLIDINDGRIASKMNIPLSQVRLGSYNRIKVSAWPHSENMKFDTNLESNLGDKSLETLRSLGRGGYRCSKLRTDWLISRQRYWGTPIPIIHCPSCGPVLVEDSKLPVELPPFDQCKSVEPIAKATSPLSTATDWLSVECPKCGNADAKRETDTMDTFVDSSWYFLRHLDPSNSTELCSPRIASDNMPVDIYIGGIEHAIRHMFYARFISHFLHFYTDIKLPDGPEPFSQFLPIGLVLGQTFKTKLGRFVPTNQVKYEDNEPVDVNTGELLVESWDKMSKSKYNGISPQSVVDKYGLDSTRLIMLSNTGPDKTRMWQENDVVLGALNWEKKMWKLFKGVIDYPVTDSKDFLNKDALLSNEKFIDSYKWIKNEIGRHYNKTFTLSAVISLLQKLTLMLMKLSTDKQCKQSILYHRILLDFLIYLYPLSPLLTAELWAQLSSHLLSVESIFIETELTYDPILGPWSYKLSQPVWEQILNERPTVTSEDSNCVAAMQ